MACHLTTYAWCFTLVKGAFECRDLIANKVPITPRILERAIACMMLDVSRREKARTPQPQLAAPGLPPPPPPDPACTVIARLDGRFDPRAYKYIDDGAAAGRLPNTAVASGGRTVDLRGLLPATVEAFVLQLFHTLFRHLRGERGGSEAGGPARASGALALIVPPFRPGLVNMASSAPERHGLVDNWDDSAHGWSQSEDDMDDSFQTSDRVRKLLVPSHAFSFRSFSAHSKLMISEITGACIMCVFAAFRLRVGAGMWERFTPSLTVKLEINSIMFMTFS